jgi:hypothetical protein
MQQYCGNTIAMKLEKSGAGNVTAPLRPQQTATDFARHQTSLNPSSMERFSWGPLLGGERCPDQESFGGDIVQYLSIYVELLCLLAHSCGTISNSGKLTGSFQNGHRAVQKADIIPLIAIV